MALAAALRPHCPPRILSMSPRTRRFFALWTVACLWRASFLLAQPLVAPGEPLSPAEEQAKFHLPPGFEIHLVASEPAIQKPMNFTFDAAGRLWVTDTVEYPYPAKSPEAARDTVKILVDRDGDGKADEISTFVERLNIPLGVQPVPGGAIVYSINSVMRWKDTDGDGKADAHERLFANFESRDTHGMVNSFTRGLDGWLYACHGFSNTSHPEGADGRKITMNSGNTFRMRMDGSHLEYFTHGQVNPFGLAFDPLGNLYSADCHTMPIYMLLRGAYYPSFGKAHDGLDFGPTMIKHNHGSSGIGGVAYYAAQQFPAEYRDTIFIGNPVTGRVNHDRLEPHGSTYEAIELPDFITCDDPWFRPVYLQVGLDGALYVADFYNRIIGHYEVPLEHPGRDRHRGRIWRVVYTGKGIEQSPKTAPTKPPNVATASLEELLQLLDDPNLTVRTLATHELVDRVGTNAIKPLAALLVSPKSTAYQRAHGMWALERLGGLDETTLQALARDPDRLVRVHAMKLLAERQWDSSPIVLAAIDDLDPFVRRAAADALGRHPSFENVKPLLKLWASAAADDTHLVHVARMALRDQLLPPGVYAQVAAMAADDLDRLANVSLGVPNAESASLVWQALQANPLRANRELYYHHAARYLADDKMAALYALVLALRVASPVERAGVLRSVMHGAGERGATLPAEVLAAAETLATELLTSTQQAQVRSGIDLAQQFHLPVFDDLARAAGRDARFGRLRQAAIDACVACDTQRATLLAAEILANPSEPMPLRQHCAAALARTNTDESRSQLAAQLQTAPERLAVAIANGLAVSAAGAEVLLDSVASGKASPRLLQEKSLATRLRTLKLNQLDERLERLTSGLPAEDERIRELIEHRRKLIAGGQPDVAKGAAVFDKSCATCHRIGERGAKIGPNLDGVGIRGVDRLLEDILDPNRNVDQAFRSTQIVSTDGKIASGLALREEGKFLVLADAEGKEIRVATDEIDQRVVSPLSPMPANVPDIVNEADFVHLIGYLLSQREQPAK
jgi:putative heme-binding domain-containing protein